MSASRRMLLTSIRQWNLPSSVSLFRDRNAPAAGARSGNSLLCSLCTQVTWASHLHHVNHERLKYPAPRPTIVLAESSGDDCLTSSGLGTEGIPSQGVETGVLAPVQAWRSPRWFPSKEPWVRIPSPAPALETGGSPTGGLFWFRTRHGVAITPMRRPLDWMPEATEVVITRRSGCIHSAGAGFRHRWQAHHTAGWIPRQFLQP
jgi:hypothetical protein